VLFSCATGQLAVFLGKPIAAMSRCDARCSWSGVLLEVSNALGSGIQSERRKDTVTLGKCHVHQNHRSARFFGVIYTQLITPTSTAKMFESDKLEDLLNVLDPLLGESDKFKQRGAAEILAGLMRGKST
jgi:hypothetical protein